MYNQPEVALEKYELTVSRIIKGRGAYICDTGIGQKLLVPYRGHEQRAGTAGYAGIYPEKRYGCGADITDKGAVYHIAR